MMRLDLVVTVMDRKKVVIALSIFLILILGTIVFVVVKNSLPVQKGNTGDNVKDNSVVSQTNIENSGIAVIISELNKEPTVTEKSVVEAQTK